jgi:hypothetical protein
MEATAFSERLVSNHYTTRRYNPPPWEPQESRIKFWLLLICWQMSGNAYDVWMARYASWQIPPYCLSVCALYENQQIYSRQNYRTLFFLLSYSLSGKILLEKLTVTKLVKKFPTFYGTRSFITMFTAARHWFISLARWIQSTPHPFL